MNENYSVVLTRCMCLSAIALLTALPGLLPPAVPFVLAMAPLVWYHLAYLRRFAGEGISQPAVDSVYYYGFLVTIGALGVTALELSIRGVSGDMTAVAFQFGLGLLATGYAVWARIHLTASSRLLDEANLEEAMNRYVERSRELVSTVELATASFDNYATTVIQKSELFASRVEVQTQTAIDAAAEQLRGAVAGMAEESRLALADLRGIINDTTFGAERDALRAGVTAMVGTVNELSASLTELKANSSASASAVGSLAGGLGEVTTQSASAASGLETLGRKDGILESFGDAVAQSRARIGELGLSADVAAVSVTTLSDRLSASADSVASFATSARQGAGAFAKLDAGSASIAALADGLGRAAEGLGAAGDAATGSRTSFDELGARLAELGDTLRHLNEALVDSTGGLKDSMIATSDALDRSLQQAIERTDSLSGVLNAKLLREPALADGAANGAA